MSASASSSWMARLKKGLERTRVQISGIFSGGVIDDALLEELEFALISADVGVATSAELIGEVRDAIRLRGLKTADEVRATLRDSLARLLQPCEGQLDLGRNRPIVILVAGVNGAGKTTTIGKLAHWLAGQRCRVLLAAGDTFRAAAREQLAVWGSRNGVDVVSQSSGDPAAVVFDAAQAARARGHDVLIADTAGRLPTQLHLMDELRRVQRALGKALPGAPHESLLVVDGTNGQNALAQVAAFDAALNLTGLIITKLDGSAKGGVVAALARQRRERPLPILFTGVGEGLEDLQRFNAREFAEALIG